ncbi:MAG TPA: kelch repeat-containing protein, partial [Acidimicrobiales bacterium]|nr:kelch repeat-containing protein [Acidimicrobiales bacterium]
MAHTSRPVPRRPHSTHRKALYRRRRIGVLAGVLSVAVIVYLLVPSGGSPPGRHPGGSPAHPVAAGPEPPPAIEAGLLPWSLSSGLSREAVLPGGGSNLLVAGGLNPAQKSLSTLLSIDVATGNKTIQGSLATAVHDSAAAVIGGQVWSFGGGSPTSVATVQQFTAPAGTGTPAPPPAAWLPPSTSGAAASPGVPGTAPVVITGATTTSTSPSPLSGTTSGSLPRPRSDHSAVTVGSTTYIVGGYDGTGPDSQIWATTDGVHFSAAGNLPVPVRYAAVTVAAGKIYAFGGEAVGGPQDGSAV